MDELEELEAMATAMCDKYCKYPNEAGEDELEEICKTRPMNIFVVEKQNRLILKPAHMTMREKLTEEHPEYVGEKYVGGCRDCPCNYGYVRDGVCHGANCKECWDREYVEVKK